MTARAIKQVRKRLGLTQNGLARRLGVSRVTVTRWENGTRKPSAIVERAIQSTRIVRDARAWEDLSQATLNELWANPEDAVYDDWRARFLAKAR